MYGLIDKERSKPSKSIPLYTSSFNVKTINPKNLKKYHTFCNFINLNIKKQSTQIKTNPNLNSLLSKSFYMPQLIRNVRKWSIESHLVLIPLIQKHLKLRYFSKE